MFSSRAFYLLALPEEWGLTGVKSRGSMDALPPGDTGGTRSRAPGGKSLPLPPNSTCTLCIILKSVPNVPSKYYTT